MSSSPRRLLAVAVAGSLLGPAALSGCAVALIEGHASPAAGPQGDVPPAEFPIIGAADDEVDRISRNALADLDTYWTVQFTPVFGRDFTPLTGGYYSVDGGDPDPAQYPNGEIGCGEPPDTVVDNAFYCGPGTRYPNGDAIQYDRAFLGALAFGTVGSEGYGRFIPALVMAHEFGHAVQGRVGYPVERSINIETQADCFAGAWTAWVADGNARYNSIRPGELDDVLRGYLLLRDPVGTDAYEGEAHGSYFDRVSAFQQGFDDGPAACRDDFDAARPYTQSAFQSDLDFATGGDAPYEQTVENFVPDGLGEFWQLAFDQLGEEFTPPDVEPFSGEAPACAGEDTDVDLLYCPADATVRYDEADLTLPLYAAEDGGDYAVLTAVAIPYALAARDQLGLSVDDRAALRSAVCLSGAFTSAVLGNETTVLSISPGDADESVSFLLEHATDPAVLPDVQLTGFQLVDVFRSGVVDGLAACDIGA